MSDPFFEQPILNSPYEYPARHWELDGAGQPTGKIADSRRRADFVTPIPKPKKTKGAGAWTAELLDQELSDSKQQYAHVATLIASVRNQVDN